MKRISKLALYGCVAGALAVSSCAKHSQPAPAQPRRAQPSRTRSAMRVDPALAKRGATLFVNRGCTPCHTIGKSGKMAGPDLAGVTDRRSLAWLRRWLKDPNAMFGQDSIADAMVVAANNVKMPNMRLSDSDIEALIHYFAEHH